MLNNLKTIVITIVCLVMAFAASADTVTEETGSNSNNKNASILGSRTSDYTLGHFSWGADLGSAVDMTGEDMTFADLHIYLGYKGAWLNFAGVGAGIDMMINNSSRCFPVYGMIRTSFASRPKLCFLDLRAGVSFNNINNYKTQTDFYGTVGIGFTLAKGRRFSSHIILSYNFMPMRPATAEIPAATQADPESAPADTQTERIVIPDLHFAAIRIGCSF